MRFIIVLLRKLKIIDMKFKSLLTVNAVVSALFGLGFVFMTEMNFDMFGIESSAGALLMGRFFGAALLGFAVIQFFVRNTEGGASQKGVVTGMLAAWVIMLVCGLYGQLAGGMAALGWMNTAIEAIFILLYGRLLASN